MTTEELKTKMRELQESQQNAFIDRLYDEVTNFVEKANNKDYTPTNYERDKFNQISKLINDMQNWF